MLLRLLSTALVVVTIARPAHAAYAQDTQLCPPSLSQVPQNPFATAANRWQLSVGDAPTSDLVEPAIREARNAYWADQVRRYVTPPGIGYGVGGGSYPGDAPEINPAGGRTFAILQFHSFKVFNAGSQKDEYLPYTEMYFLLKRVIASPTNQSLQPGKLISIDFAGGRLRTSTGQVQTLNVSPMSHFFQLGHTYLVQMRPSIAGTFSDSKRWDVTSGVIVPDTDQEISRAKEGKSRLKGQTVDDVIPFIYQSLEDQQAH